ncbi:MAG: peptidylprolyl isomerase [Flavobacteriales bacterium]|nr:peptidylprolyl isomerase [Flavobacteriales bacterium]
MKKYLLVLIVALISNLSIAQSDEVILAVGEDKVTLDEFKAIFLKNNHNDSLITKQYLNDYMKLFVNFRLKVKEAKELKYDTISEFVNELAMYRNQLAKPYLNDNQFDEKLINEAYERMQTDIKASHILISVAEKALPADTLKAYNKAISIRNKILKGMDFAKAAKQYSDDKSAANNGGDLGYFSVFMMVYPFESAAYNTNLGETSEPVRTKYGYHLVKVNAKRKAIGEVKVAHIMFKTAKGATNNEIITSKSKIDEIVLKLKNGEDFAQLAEKFSEDKATAVKGGNLPWFGVGKMVKEFENSAFSLQEIGSVSPPFKTDFGWHIIKLLEKKPIPEFKDVQDKLKKKVNQDSRNSLRDKALISKIKNEYKFKQYNSRLNEIAKYTDENLSDGKWNSEKANSLKRNLFVLDGKYYTQADFVSFILENQMKVNDNYQSYFNDLYQAFVSETCLSFENSRLEKKYPEFKSLLQEYTDGILLFDLMDDMVWTKAIKDTVGLQEYFDANKEDYMWSQRVEAKIYTCIDQEIAKKTLRQIKKRHRMPYLTDEDVLKKVNYNSPLNLQINGKKYTKYENEYISKTDWKVGISNNIQGKDGSVIIVDILEIIPPQQKQLSETKGKVISDYQDFLEKQWIKKLRIKYPVVINTKVLYSLTQ